MWRVDGKAEKWIRVMMTDKVLGETRRGMKGGNGAGPNGEWRVCLDEEGGVVVKDEMMIENI